MTVKQAENISEEIKKRIIAYNLAIAGMTVHMESALDRISRESTRADTELKCYVMHAARRFPGIKSVYGVKVRKIENDLHVNLACQFYPTLHTKGAREFSDRLEKTNRNAYPHVARVVIDKERA
jgi:divalent metal cation (Fe/Co/Zn/Cd) transporter